MSRREKGTNEYKKKVCQEQRKDPEDCLTL